MSVTDTNVIDLVHLDQSAQIVYLTITDHLDWVDENEHIWLLQEKINKYLAFIEGGDLQKKYTYTQDKKIVIRVFGMFPLTKMAFEFYSNAKQVIEGAGHEISFEQKKF